MLNIQTQQWNFLNIANFIKNHDQYSVNECPKELRIESGKVREKVGWKDFLINGLIITSDNLITSSFYGKTIKGYRNLYKKYS